MPGPDDSAVRPAAGRLLCLDCRENKVSMQRLLTPSQRVALALRRAENALRNWQDDPDSPRKDVDKMLAAVRDLRLWVQGHVLADIERAEKRLKERTTPASEENPSAPS